MTGKNDTPAPKPPVRDDRPDRDHPADEWWLEPHDGDVAAERDAARHTDDRWAADW